MVGWSSWVIVSGRDGDQNLAVDGSRHVSGEQGHVRQDDV